MSRDRDPERPIEAVQNAAVEHAVAAGESRAALALAGALDARREAETDASDSGDRDPPHGDPATTALSMTVTALIGRHLSGDPRASAREPVSAPEPSAARRAPDEARHPAVVGAAVACERFDLTVARAATLAACDRSAVESALAARARERSAANDPPDDE